ncbi:hypothetical protein EDD18DRAFT_813680 [Armillaria luteobubalina]|uniref:Uncharacterized protein n=1 Tax=Armillaria luteobubalina TaxID=153913 RepID=A0AA39QBX8_9AGAR|nr:hypothetical protein EDD18DRAFT_813680 [Armillaria luteobubalina]
MAFRAFALALFSLFLSRAAAVANPLASRDLPSSIEILRFTADSITRDSAVFWQYPLASSANTVLTDVITFNSQVQTALTQIPVRSHSFFPHRHQLHCKTPLAEHNHVRGRRRQHAPHVPRHLLRRARRVQRARYRRALLCALRAQPDALLLERVHPSWATHLGQ